MNKTVLITGASSGIGKATALYFADKGWNVAASMRKPFTVNEFDNFKNIKQYALDITDTDTMKKALEAVLKDFGTVDVLVNNAGYGSVGAFEASDSTQVQQQFAVNVFGLMDLTRLVVPLFRSQRHGHVVNVGSMGGRLTFPLYSVYHATKWAVDGFSEALMYELRPFNIQVKLIEPGLIRTEFTGHSESQFVKPGLDVYDSYVDHRIKNYHKTYTHAAAPYVVAKTIYRAANSTSNKLRYIVGMPAPLLLALRRLLPERLFFMLIRLGAK